MDSNRFSSAQSMNVAQENKAMDEYKRKMKEKAEQENSNLWQHPFVDVFKHFKLLPGSDFKQNKKVGDVQEYFAKEIGRRAIKIEGSISANNYVQVPHPQGTVKQLGLTGRYVYFQVKCPRHGLPFSYHLDLGMAERSHGIRVSMSNLYKNFATSNGFVAQVPLELKNNCWSIVVIDLFDILKKSNILPPTYMIEGSYQIRSVTICANTHVRGVFTSDNFYEDCVTLPADMRFKFAFELERWAEYFDWQALPRDWSQRKGANGEYPGDENMNLQNLISSQKKVKREDLRKQMRGEIDGLLGETNKPLFGEDEEEDDASEIRKQKYEQMQRELNMQFNAGPADHPATGYVIHDDEEGEQGIRQSSGAGSKLKPANQTGKSTGMGDYRSGQFSGYELSRSHKLNKDPIMELKHIIGYQADMCSTIKWSRLDGENVVIFSSGGTLIAMDTESNQQKRFFFGHSAPIVCFDINANGNMLASAQEGKNSIIRIWDYATARCITMVTMPVVSLKCLSFSHDGRFLASVGKDAKNKELIVIWDISRVQRGEKPVVVAKQTSEFNILALKFSPIDASRLASCGQENIRFWRVRDTSNIRGSAVVLNHHARKTVFTCLDFEYGFKSADRDENEALKRIFVGSKHGMVFQVNYQDETLEATYKTNDHEIFSIAVNDAFCVTGSADTFLRVWPLDFQEFFMEAQHEGTVSAVDISPDGLKVVCGTLYGSVGILDKSNQNYKTLTRSHTDEIIALDFHFMKMNLITVSKDKTIRLWDVETFDELYEFSSTDEQPLCVSGHPTLPIFACGFHTGTMRIFDIDTTQVIDSFTQFNKPLKSIKYDNTGKLLVCCCEDGSVAIHNAARQHLPIKMMHLELPPEYVHVAFTDRILGEDESLQKFGVVGEYGNNVTVYDTDSFLLHHQIMVNNIVKSFKFANNNRDLLVVTKDCKVKFFSLLKYEGILLREVANCHRGAITGLDVSLNSNYMLTGGEDNMLKIWDYEAQKTVPFFFQSFIGHTYPLSSIIFNPRNNNQIISVGERDGIFIWDFNGEVETENQVPPLAGQDLQSLTTIEEKAPSLLEKIRTTNKAKKAFRNQLNEDTFIIPEFKTIDQGPPKQPQRDFIETPMNVKQHRIDRKLTYNHYAGCSQRMEVEVEGQQLMNYGGAESKNMLLEQKLVNGYDGYGGVHDNLVWNAKGGYTYFTLNNKLIIERTKSQNREQHIFADSQVQLSCIAQSKCQRFIAVGEGHENAQGNSLVYLYDIEKLKKVQTLPFHQKGIQSIDFSNDSRFLITLGVQSENSLALWDINSGLVSHKATIGNYSTNQVKVDPHVDGADLAWVIVGNDAGLTYWRFKTDTLELTFLDVSVPENLRSTNFLCVDYTPKMPGVDGGYRIVIGADDGSVVVNDANAEGTPFIDVGTRGRVIDGQIGVISIQNNFVVIGSSRGMLARYPLGPSCQPDDPDTVQHFATSSAIVALTLDANNNEGLCGTEEGAVYYVDFDNFLNGPERTDPIKIIQGNNQNQDPIRTLKFDSQPTIFLTDTGPKSDVFKIFATENCDQVNDCVSNYDEDGHVVFITFAYGETSRQKKDKRLIGFSNGVIKRFDMKKLEAEHVFKIPMNIGEKLTCGLFSENKSNFACGTNQGTLIIGSLQIIGKKSVDATYCRIENVGNFQSFESRSKSLVKLNSDIMNDQESIDLDRQISMDDTNEMTGITSVSFPSIDPIGTILLAFDNGTIKVWQSTVFNEQLMAILKLQNKQQPKEAQAPPYDVSQIGYQQYDLIDCYDLFDKPHAEMDDEVYDEPKRVISYEKADFGGINISKKSLYSGKGKKYKNCIAQFAPGTKINDQYFCIVEALQYIYVRNFKTSVTLKQISLLQFPTCMNLIDIDKIKGKIDEDASLKETLKAGGTLVSLGTKEGKVIIYRVAHASHNKLFQTKSGIAFGEITSIDVTPTCSDLAVGTQSGEIIQYGLLKKLNEE